LPEEPDLEAKLKPVESWLAKWQTDEETGFAPFYKLDGLLDQSNLTETTMAEFRGGSMEGHPLRSLMLAKDTLQFAIQWYPTFYVPYSRDASSIGLSRYEV
jgi:hypothetical protein